MFMWPMNEATCRGVSPDWEEEGKELFTQELPTFLYMLIISDQSYNYGDEKKYCISN